MVAREIRSVKPPARRYTGTPISPCAATHQHANVDRDGASDLARILGRSRSATSQHLRVLREADVVKPSRNGNVVRYKLATDINAEILQDIGRAFDRLEPSTAA